MSQKRAEGHPAGDPGNPFEEYDLPPDATPEVITRLLRERIEQSSDEAERAALREAWEQLTRRPVDRLKWALLAVPDLRPAPGRRPRPVRPSQRALSARDLEVRSALCAALEPAPSPRGGRPRSPDDHAAGLLAWLAEREHEQP